MKIEILIIVLMAGFCAIVAGAILKEWRLT